MSVPRVKITELGDSGDKGEIRRIFAKFGHLTNVWIATDPPGFAYVFYDNFKDADRAVRAMDGEQLCGVTVSVQLSPIEDRYKQQNQGYERGRGRGGGSSFRQRRYSGGGGVDHHRDGSQHQHGHQQRYSRQNQHEFRSSSRGSGRGGRSYPSSDYDNRRPKEDRYSSDDGYSNDRYSSRGGHGGHGRERGGGGRGKRGHYDNHMRHGGRDYDDRGHPPYGNRDGRHDYGRRGRGGGGGGDYGGDGGYHKRGRRGGGPPSRQYHDDAYHGGRGGEGGGRYRNEYKFDRGREGRGGGGGDYFDDDYRSQRQQPQRGFIRGRGGAYGGRGGGRGRGGGGGRSYGGGGGGYDDRGDHGYGGRGGRKHTRNYSSDFDDSRRRPPKDEQFGRDYHGGRNRHSRGSDEMGDYRRPSAGHHRNPSSEFHHIDKNYGKGGGGGYRDRYSSGSAGGGGGYHLEGYLSDEEYRDRSPHHGDSHAAPPHHKHRSQKHHRKHARLSSSSSHHYHHERPPNMSKSPSLSPARSLSHSLSPDRSISSTYSSRSRSRSHSRSHSRSRSPRSPQYNYTSAALDTQKHYLVNQAAHESQQPVYDQPPIFPPTDISEYHTEDSYEASTHFHPEDPTRHVEYENQVVYSTPPEQRTVTHNPTVYEEESVGGESREVREIKYSDPQESGSHTADRFVKMENKIERDDIVQGDEAAPLFAEGEHKATSIRRSSRQARYSDGSFSPPALQQRRVRTSRSQRGGSPVHKKRSEWHDICVV